jgi:hypothetical protein
MNDRHRGKREDVFSFFATTPLFVPSGVERTEHPSKKKRPAQV